MPATLPSWSTHGPPERHVTAGLVGTGRPVERALDGPPCGRKTVGREGRGDPRGPGCLSGPSGDRQQSPADHPTGPTAAPPRVGQAGRIGPVPAVGRRGRRFRSAGQDHRKNTRPGFPRSNPSYPAESARTPGGFIKAYIVLIIGRSTPSHPDVSRAGRRVRIGLLFVAPAWWLAARRVVRRPFLRPKAREEVARGAEPSRPLQPAPRTGSSCSL